MSKISDEVMSKFYGCGCPIPPLEPGLVVLDLGNFIPLVLNRKDAELGEIASLHLHLSKKAEKLLA